MFEKNVLGICGHGFVGEALEVGMRHAFTVLVHDPYKYDTNSWEAQNGRLIGRDNVELINTLDELTKRCEVIFVAVPTPMNKDGSASTKIVESVVARIAEFERKNVVVIKSTVPPGTTQRLHRTFGEYTDPDPLEPVHGSCQLKGVVFNPEFLTEANYIDDFKNQNRIIIGCDDDAPKTIIKQVYQRAYPKVSTIKTHSTIAEMVKYTTNCFLATKLSFANEIYQVCAELGVDYDKVVEYARYDERLGNSHWAVPGPMPDSEGNLLPGFSGSCIPKDLNALMARAKELGIDPKVMKGVWEKNLEVRPGRDWENLKGRAVTEED